MPLRATFFLFPSPSEAFGGSKRPFPLRPCRLIDGMALASRMFLENASRWKSHSLSPSAQKAASALFFTSTRCDDRAALFSLPSGPPPDEQNLFPPSLGVVPPQKSTIPQAPPPTPPARRRPISRDLSPSLRRGCALLSRRQIVGTISRKLMAQPPSFLTSPVTGGDGQNDSSFRAKARSSRFFLSFPHRHFFFGDSSHPRHRR